MFYSGVSTDLCVPCADGVVNIRVGALIAKDGKILMVESCRGYLFCRRKNQGGGDGRGGCCKRGL